MRRRYFASQGFYVVVDYQTMAGGPSDNVLDKDAFETQWVALVSKLLQVAPEAHGKILLDLINEPDGCAHNHLPEGMCTGGAGWGLQHCFWRLGMQCLAPAEKICHNVQLRADLGGQPGQASAGRLLPGPGRQAVRRLPLLHLPAGGHRPVQVPGRRLVRFAVLALNWINMECSDQDGPQSMSGLAAPPGARALRRTPT